MTTDLTAVNLFAGIEGFGLALHSAGIRTVAAVELDHAARGVIHDQFPDTTLFNDVCEVTADDLRAAGFVPKRGILTAGWPCQDLSVAGRRLGLGGARSGLFWEIVRLLGELHPKWFILENVPGLLSAVCPCIGDNACGGGCTDSHPVRGGACGPGRCMELHGGAMGAVLGALGNLGYGVAYRVLDAQYFGVAQRRRRVVFVGCLGDWAAPAQVLLEPESGGGDSAPRRAPGPGFAVVSALSASEGGADDNDAQGGHLIAGSLTTGASAGGGWRVGADEAAANHVVPTVSAKWAKGVGGPAGDETQNLVLSTALTTRAGATFDDQQTGQLVPVAYQCHGSNVGEAGTLRAGNGGLTGGVPFTALPAAWRGRGMEMGNEPVANALRSGGAGNMSDHAGYVVMDAVRRLTPVECERLQGFPDGWTATSWGKPQSDSARYRELGNSVAVPVFGWVARRTVAVDAALRAVTA